METLREKVSDRVTAFCGSWTFVLTFASFVGVWVILNTLLLMAGQFDPYPFIFLNLVLTVVSTFQGPLIMMSQNRTVERDREAIMGLHDKLDTIIKEENEIIGLARGSSLPGH